MYDYWCMGLVQMQSVVYFEMLRLYITFTEKPNNEYVQMNSKYNEYYKNTYEHLINIANNWIIDECEVGVPMYHFNGQFVGTALKKTKKKSDIHLIVSYST